MGLVVVERVEEWIDDELMRQFEAIDAQHPVTSEDDGDKVSFEAQRIMTDLCEDDYDKLHQLRAWLFLCREMSPKMTIPAVKQGCSQAELIKLAGAAGKHRQRRDPLRHSRITRTNY